MAQGVYQVVISVVLVIILFHHKIISPCLHFVKSITFPKPMIVMQFYSLHWVSTLEHFCTLFHVPNLTKNMLSCEEKNVTLTS